MKTNLNFDPLIQWEGVKIKEGIMFNSAQTAYVCPICYKEFPLAYEVKNPSARVQNTRKRYGTKQLMKLHAYSNYKRHVKACEENCHQAIQEIEQGIIEV